MERLPDDLVLLVLHDLHYVSLCRLSQASQRFHRLSDEASLWERQLRCKWRYSEPRPEPPAPRRRARIDGLQSRPALNGTVGVVLHWEPQQGREGRWAVKTAGGETILLRDSSLHAPPAASLVGAEWRVQVRERHLRDCSVAPLLDSLQATNHDKALAEQATAWKQLLSLGRDVLPRLNEAAADASQPPRRRLSARHAARAIHCEDVLERWADLASRATMYCIAPTRQDQPWTWLDEPWVGRAPRAPAAAGELEEAALLLVAWHLDDRQLVDSDGALAAVRRELDALAARVRERARVARSSGGGGDHGGGGGGGAGGVGGGGGGDARATLRALLSVLFEEEGLAGNEGAYYDARNSLLDHVLRRRLGIPITLSLVAVAVGARVGLRLDCIGLPGHFLLALRSGTDDDGGGGGGAPPTYTHVDAFRRGALLTEDDCRAIVASYRQWAWSDGFLRPVPPPEVWQRMLRNLLGCTRGDARAQHRLQQLMPGAPLASIVLGSRARPTYEAHCRLWPVNMAAAFPQPHAGLPPVENLAL